MKKNICRSVALFIILLYALSVLTISVSSAVTYTNSKGTVKVVCGKYSKKFKAKKYNHNFSKALNAALETARKKSTSKKIATVTVSKGYYYLDRTIKIYSDTTLKANNCYFKYYGNLIRNGYNKKASKASGYSGAKNITIIGGSWDAAVPYSQAGTSNWRIQHSTMRFAHCKNLKIENCTFKNNYNCHDIELGGVDTAKINKCNFYNDKGVNIFKNDGGRESIQLDVCTSEAMPEFKNFDYTTCKNITLCNSSFKNKFRGIGSHHAVLGNTFDNIKVYNNTFQNIGGIAVYGVYWTNSKIYGNTMKSVGLGVDVRNMTTGSGYNFYNLKKISYSKCDNAVKNSKIYIYDNTINLRKSNNTYARACGVRVMGDYYEKNDTKTGVKAGVYKVYGVNVGTDSSGNAKPNTISGNVAAGVQLNYAVDSSVKYNSINLNSSVSDTSNGIEIKGCENTSVISNTVKNGKIKDARGIYLTPTAAGFADENITVTNNSVTNFLMSGIYSYKAYNSILENNTVNDCLDMGISIRTCDKVSVNKNNLSNNKNSGVYVYSNSSNTTVSENIIGATKSTGIKIKESSATKANDNKISDSGEYGFLVRQSIDTEIMKNEITNPLSYGVRINYGSDNTELVNNNITSPKSECIYFNGANDPTKDVEKTLTVAQNCLNSPDSTAAVSVAYDNVAAKIYSNYRADDNKLFYRFKGDDDAKYTSVYDTFSIEDLSLEKFDEYNTLNWSSAGDEIKYRVYRKDENGFNLISETPEISCIDNDLFVPLESQNDTDNSYIDDNGQTSVRKLNVFYYSVSPYREFSNVKFFGEEISVNFE